MRVALVASNSRGTVTMMSMAGISMTTVVSMAGVSMAGVSMAGVSMAGVSMAGVTVVGVRAVRSILGVAVACISMRFAARIVVVGMTVLRVTMS